MRPLIVVDTSALMAILLEEPDAARYKTALADSDSLISLATMVELGCVARRKLGPSGIEEAKGLLDDVAATTVPLDRQQADIALAAMERYGKGRGKPLAVLNYGDLFSYALAKARDLPLLYKGGDFFAQTDVCSALAERSG